MTYYVLRIIISHDTLELHSDSNDSNKKGFIVNVMIMEI